jgi:hypothetical protein
MRWRISLTLALIAFVGTACDQQPVEPTAEEVVDAPVFNFTNGPENPGNSWIAREAGWDDICFWCETSDPPGSRLFAAHYQADDVSYCGGSSNWKTPWDYQGGVNGGGVHYLSQTFDQPLFIYDMDALYTACATFPEPCCTFLATGWLYQGTHDMVALERYQDNSEYAQMKGNGFVYDPDGNQYRYREHQKVYYTTEGDDWTHEEIAVY